MACRLFWVFLFVTHALAWHMRYDANKCAESVIPHYVGPCPRQIIVLFGNLEVGRCHSLGYNHFHETLHIRAGPCGVIDFRVFTKKTKQKNHTLLNKSLFRRLTEYNKCRSELVSRISALRSPGTSIVLPK